MSIRKKVVKHYPLSNWCRNAIDEKNPAWKGDMVKYRALHIWVERRLGRPNICEDCGTTKAKRYDWANELGEYKRELRGWIRLCRSCHIKRDKSNIRNRINGKFAKTETINKIEKYNLIRV